MADAKRALIGVAPCGCITAVQIEGYAGPEERREFYTSMADTGRDVRTVDFEAIKRDPLFMVTPEECPHKTDGAA